MGRQQVGDDRGAKKAPSASGPRRHALQRQLEFYRALLLVQQGELKEAVTHLDTLLSSTAAASANGSAKGPPAASADAAVDAAIHTEATLLRATLHSVDRAAMTVGRVFRATKHLLPDSKIKK